MAKTKLRVVEEPAPTWQPPAPLKAHVKSERYIETRDYLLGLMRKAEDEGRRDSTCAVRTAAEFLLKKHSHGHRAALIAAVDDTSFDAQAVADVVKLWHRTPFVGTFDIEDHRDRVCSCYCDPTSPQYRRTRVDDMEDDLAELRAYLPMLARLAFAEKFSGASIPDAIARLEEWTRLGEYPGFPVQSDHPEFRRPKDEPLPAAAQEMQDAYTRRTSPWVVAS